MHVYVYMEAINHHPFLWLRTIHPSYFPIVLYYAITRSTILRNCEAISWATFYEIIFLKYIEEKNERNNNNTENKLFWRDLGVCWLWLWVVEAVVVVTLLCYKEGCVYKAGHRVKDCEEKRRAELRQKHVLVTVSWWSYFSLSVSNCKGNG